MFTRHPCAEDRLLILLTRDLLKEEPYGCIVWGTELQRRPEVQVCVSPFWAQRLKTTRAAFTMGPCAFLAIYLSCHGAFAPSSLQKLGSDFGIPDLKDVDVGAGPNAPTYAVSWKIPGPSTHYLRTLVPTTIPSMVLGTRVLKYWVLGHLGFCGLPKTPCLWQRWVMWRASLCLGSPQDVRSHVQKGV